MSTVPPKPIPVVARSGRPSTRNLLGWGTLVLTLHLAVLMSLAGTLDWQLSAPQTLRSGPIQTRTTTASAATPTANALPAAPAARTRIALVEKRKPKPITPTKPAAPKAAATAQQAPTAMAVERTPSAESRTASDQDVSESANLTSTESIQPTDLDSLADTKDTGPVKDLEASTDKQVGPMVAGADVPAPITPGEPASLPVTTAAAPPVAPPASEPSPLQSAASVPNVSAPANPEAWVPVDTPIPDPATGQTNLKSAASPASPNPSGPSNDVNDQPATTAAESIASATLALPELALASLPPSALLSYRLNGQEKGISYQASGELRWQHNASAYNVSLSVRAFLLGSRHWRSVGQINNTGLSPTRFSDSWRSERAAHFDRPNQRIVFSNNAPTTALQLGAQDQVSLYVQLAAAMAQSSDQMPPGTRLQIQTATVRDALPWLLTLEKLETLQMDGQSVQAVKWVCRPRNRFDAQVEFWVSSVHDWLPARIRITQASGSYIDLQLIGREALDALPLTP